MTLNLTVPETRKLQPRITVFGVGGAGGNAVSNMIDSGLEGVDFVVANTDAQALAQSAAEHRIQIGASVTEGLGAGSRPEVGREAAEEAHAEILEHLTGSHMVFITAGMGGGTGTGAAPVIARIAREQGILTVGVVTKPFQFEGGKRMILAEQGIEELQKYADTLIIIPNQNLFRVADEKTTFSDAFAMADAVLHSGVSGITDLMIKPGLINLDFADVRSVMDEMGRAMMGTGEASGEKRAIEAAETAITNPILDDISMKGARGVLVNIIGGMDMTLYEVDQAANRIREEVDPEANIIVGSTFDGSLEGTMRISVVATGIDSSRQTRTRPMQPSSIRLVQGHATDAAPAVQAPFLSVPSAEDAPPPPAAHQASPAPATATATAPATAMVTSALATAREPVMESPPVGGYEAEVIIRRGSTATMAATAVAVQPQSDSMAASVALDPHTEGVPAFIGDETPDSAAPPAHLRRGSSLFERLAQARRMRAEASMPKPASAMSSGAEASVAPVTAQAEPSVETPPAMPPVMPEPAMTEAAGPEAFEPEVPEVPEVFEPETFEPESFEPEDPEAMESEVFEPEVPELEAPEPEAFEPEVPETPDAYEPVPFEPEAFEPEVIAEEPSMTALAETPQLSAPAPAPTPTPAPTPEPVLAKAPAPVEASADPVASLPEMEEDQLEIPAFLRRQGGQD